MKRKADNERPANGGKPPGSKKAKPSLSDGEAKQRFRCGLFDGSALDSYSRAYAASSPYKHAVIHDLVDDALLRSVRREVRHNVHFTPKETDIYKIHQSGDLANLDGLDDASLAKLPSLLALRDAIYSQPFRDCISSITACGPLSGRKTDMAINLYIPGCYLLCHDDVIGSRRVSYILYLTDPDEPWEPEWGGALRLLPVQTIRADDGQEARTPLPDVAKVIPPAWNQLSFFAVQPGQSFHDVEEVYHAESKARLGADGGRVRMAISGWFHIPQVGEPGYVEGEEEKNAKNSSLMQLQGDPAQYDMPRPRPAAVDAPEASRVDFDEADLEFLLKYIAPTYLTPDTLEQILDHFAENSSITLPDMLSKRFAQRLRHRVADQDSRPLPDDSAAIEKATPWRVAKPPHKHRYLYQQSGAPDQLRTSQEESPVTELLDILLPSRQFRQWLQLATGCTVESSDIVARRFRRGHDYTLATGHEGKSRLELNLGITPTPGWGDDGGDGADLETDPEAEAGARPRGRSNAGAKGEGKAAADDAGRERDEDVDVGGHEVYMAGDDDADDDAAVYKSSGVDDNILFFQAAAWNKLTIVLRDSGTLKFVKYVSRRAPGDRWDVSGVYQVQEPHDEDESLRGDGNVPLGESDEEEFNGFSDSVDSESD